MKTIKTKVYTFDELSDDAKEVARNWCHEFVADYDWWDAIYEDAKTIGLKLTSFNLDRNRHATGQLLENTEIVAINILKNHGTMTDTYKLADSFLHDFKKAKTEEEREQLSEEFERNLLEEYSIILQKEYEYMYSDEYVDEIIKANDYTFLENGKRFG